MQFLLIAFFFSFVFADCNDHKTCADCARGKTSILRRQCTWCPNTNKCESPGLIWDKCQIVIKELQFCPSELPVREPIVLVPGIGGTVLETKSNAAMCKWDGWRKTWVTWTKFIAGWDCVAETLGMRFTPLTGWMDRFDTETRAVNGLRGIEYVDPDNRLSRQVSGYYNDMSSWLQGRYGYKEGVNLLGFGYDWRKTVTAHDEEFFVLKGEIERMVRTVGKKAVIIAHSFGGILMHRFLTTQVDLKWKQEFIKSFIPVAVPFGGSCETARAVLSGSNFNIPILSVKKGFKLSPRVGGLYNLLPRSATYGNDPIVTFGDKSFSAHQMAEMFSLAGLPFAQEKVDQGLGGVSLVDPQVKVYLTYSTKVNTEKTFFYTQSFVATNLQNVQNGPVRIEYEDGDGTVAMRSAIAPVGAKWADITVKEFTKIEHGDIVQDEGHFKYVMERVLE